MAKQLKNIFVTGSDAISQGFTINAKHVSQSVEAFTAQEAYDISISGSQSITGSLRHKSTGPDGTVKLDLKLNNDPSFKVVVIDTSLLANTIAPIIAINNRIEASSKGNK